ncbi:MAG: flagellar basal body-associated FliL family protein [Peptococcaceae bacterium]|nr:flagellar basal body-associated FliL family protein [Peptococcaceae bacterium]
MPGDNEKATKNKKGQLVIVLLVLLVVLAGSGAGWYFFIREDPNEFYPIKNTAPDEDEYEEADNSRKNNQYMYPPGTKFNRLEYNDVIVNLVGDGGSGYLRVSLTLEYPAAAKKLIEEIAEKDPLIKDAILTSLSSKTKAEVFKRDELKNSLLKDINRNLLYGDFTEIYFTDFLVQ